MPEKIINNFKNKTEKAFSPIDSLSISEITDVVKDYISDKITEYDFDVNIIDILISGSRCRGLEKPNSDLDIILYYSGSEREDDVFNLLHEEEFLIGDVLIDINPISGDLSYYLEQTETYLQSKQKEH
jgi:predicted nucleotidyltransferase